MGPEMCICTGPLKSPGMQIDETLTPALSSRLRTETYRLLKKALRQESSLRSVLIEILVLTELQHRLICGECSGYKVSEEHCSNLA